MTTTELYSEPAPRPRFFTLRTLQIVFLIVGIFISGYLSYVKLTNVPMQCIVNSVFSCEKVQASSYSVLFGVPIAWFGLATYLILLSVIALESRIGFLERYSNLIVFAISLFAWIFSMYLVYLQFSVIQALCPWCLAHELNFTIFFGLSLMRLIRSMQTSEE